MDPDPAQEQNYFKRPPSTHGLMHSTETKMYSLQQEGQRLMYSTEEKALSPASGPKTYVLNRGQTVLSLSLQQADQRLVATRQPYGFIM